MSNGTSDYHRGSIEQVGATLPLIRISYVTLSKLLTLPLPSFLVSKMGIFVPILQRYYEDEMS